MCPPQSRSDLPPRTIQCWWAWIRRPSAAMTDTGVVESLPFFKDAEQRINNRMKIYKANLRWCHKIHSGSIANIPVVKVLLVLPKVISLAARSHLARDGRSGLLWALNTIYPRIISVKFCCLFKSYLFWVTCYLFIYKYKCIHVYEYKGIHMCVHTCILTGCLHKKSQELFGWEITVFSFSSKPCFMKMTRRSATKLYCPPVPLLAPSSSTSQRLLFTAKRQSINQAMLKILPPFPAPERRNSTLPGLHLGTFGLATLLLYKSTSEEWEMSRMMLLGWDTCSCTSAKGWPATIPNHVTPHRVAFICQLLIQNPLLFPMCDLPPLVLLDLKPPLQLLAIHLSLWTVHYIQTKAGKQEVPSTKSFQGATSRYLPPGCSCNRLMPSHKAAAAPERNSSPTQGHTQAHTGQQTPNKLFCCTLIPPIFKSEHSGSLRLFLPLILPQTIVQTHSEWRCSGSSSSIFSSIAKLYTIKQPNFSTLLLILLLQHCKRKKYVGLFF